MTKKYYKRKSGEGIRIDLAKDSLYEACCDCGSVHIIQFNHIEGDIWDMVAFSQPRRTGQLRRHKYGNLQTDLICKGKYFMTQSPKDIWVI